MGRINQNDPLRGHQRSKSSNLETTLRSQIVEGVFPPGSRLPTRGDLQRQFRVSVVTVQRALHELTSQRIIEARRRAGTFVVKNPPHLCEFVIVFSLSSHDPNLSWFDQVIAREAPGVAQQRNARAEVYYGVEPHVDNQSYIQLCRRAQRQGMAGIIFGDSPGTFLNTPLMQAPRIPRVTFGPMGIGPDEPPSVVMNYHDWFDKAMNYLIGRGRRRIALIGITSMGEQRDRVLAGLKQRGMETRPQWMHSPSLHFPAAISNVAHLMMCLPPNDRPDGLIIDDDHFVEHATAGLVAAGVQAGSEIDVVAHSNFPWPTRHVIPVRRLGFDARQLLHTCFDLLEKQRQNKPVTHITPIPAVFEDEVVA